VIRKKTIRAPFAGRLGIRLVNLGQVIGVGAAIVSLQSVDPVFVNFSLPQQQLARVRTGLEVRLRTNAVAGEVFGTISAINPQIDTATRNVTLQATVLNPGERLRPGMFVDVAVRLPGHRLVLAIPAPGVLYAPYGDSVFIVERGAAGAASGPSGLVVRQQLIRLGERRGDFVAVLDGIKTGQVVVSTGAFKLRNGQAVVVDNSLSPRFELAPKPSDS
jgi:membrane fusion protein, multidrug efflux system